MRKHNIFLIAVFISLMWHMLWLSTITIVAPQNKDLPVKFSKVTFLGPLPGKMSMSVRMEPLERTFLEKRYLNSVRGITAPQQSGFAASCRKYEACPGYADLSINENLIKYIDEAVSGIKLAPVSSME